MRNRKFHHVDPFGDQSTLLSSEPVTTVIDAGANVGNLTAYYRAAFPQARVFAFEPGDEASAKFAQRFADDPMVTLDRRAISRDGAPAVFHSNELSVLSSLLPSAQKSERYMGEVAHRSRSVTVETVSFDAFAASKQLDRIDVLKMDIQGAEGEALHGASGLLSRAAIRLIYTEVLFGDLYDGQAYFHDVSGLLYQYGYKLFGLYNLVQGTDRTLSYGDAIFMCPAIAGSLKPIKR